MAGSQHGVRLEPEELIAAARRGRADRPAQRTTLYEIIETYGAPAASASRTS